MNSQSASPSRLLSKLRRDHDGGSESGNATDSASHSEDNLDRTLTPPTDGASTKFRDVFRRKSVDVDGKGTSPDGARRLSRFRAGRKNKLTGSISNEAERTLSIDSEHANGDSGLSRNQSESSLNLDGSGANSVLTDDGFDDAEQQGKVIRPPLSTHNSHAGYLTLSAPEINSQIVSEPLELQSDAIHDPTSNPQSAIDIPHIIEPEGGEGRRPSVTDKLKSAFSERARGSADADSIASDTSFDLASNEEKVLPGTPINKRPRSIDTSQRPETPPNLIDTPTTYVTPPTPTDPNIDASTFPRKSPTKSSYTGNRTTSPSRDSVRGRKINLPSKLSHSIAAPLTPTVEESKTPGGTLSQPTNATGFFSTVFTAAQKAADSLSNTIVTTSPKGKSTASQSIADRAGEESRSGAESSRGVEEEKGQSSVDTIASGTSVLDRTGNTDSNGIANETSPAADMPVQNGHAEHEDTKKAEETAAARAVSEAYQAPVEKVVSQAQAGDRPLSIASNERITVGGQESPPRSTANGDALHRSGSVRSRISGRHGRGRRGTTGTAGTGNSIAAGLSASVGGMSNLAANGTGKRLTGFAVASNKRNKDFHQLFRSVPEDDYLIEDYSAALQRDILLHGRLYVSEGHLCFSSNILGWVTNLVISFDEVVAVEKKTTAVIFPNAIVIGTSSARSTFASFVARDSTYELIIGIWKINHPNLKSSQNGVTLDNSGTGDKTEIAAEDDDSDASSDTASDNDVYDEDANDDGASFADGGPTRSIAGSDAGDQPLSRQASGNPLPPAAVMSNGTAHKIPEGAEAPASGASAGTDFSGPATHEPTQCAESAEHYDRALTDTTIAAPLGKVYSLIFGPQSTNFMRKWHDEDQKSRDLHLPDTILDNDHKTLTFDYIKPLNAPVGPRQTKCITTYTLLAFDLEKAVTVDCSTQTPDVPSGSVFVTKTRYCLMWGPANSTRLIANCTIEWTGKSWLKGPIEKGANDGQLEFIKSLVAAVSAAVATKSSSKGPAKKSKKRSRKETADVDDSSAKRDTAVVADKPSDWGLFEPVHGLLQPFISLLGPFATSQTVIAVLFALLLYTWINPPASKGTGVGSSGYSPNGRPVSYEEMWRREENDLWDWLEDRVGLEGVYAPALNNQNKDRQKNLAAKRMGQKLDDQRMQDRQVDGAIEITEQRLAALKEAVARKKAKKAM